MNKTELLEELEDGQKELIEMLENLPDEVMLEPGVCGNWSIKDILMHLTMWEGETVTLLFQIGRGVVKPSTAHFGNETVDEINQRWQSANQDRPLNLIWSDWLGVRKQTIRRVLEISEEDLKNPNKFVWQKGEPLWQLIQDNTFDHEDEHADAIGEWLEKKDSTSENGK